MNFIKDNVVGTMNSVSVPKGNTQKGVNKQVYRILSESVDLKLPLRMVDVPCGDGIYAEFIKKNHPQSLMTGVDFLTTVKSKMFEFHKLSAQDYFSLQKPVDVDVITCISGVMCFDGLADLFQSFHQALRSGGLLIITNDNVMTVRDRLSFLFFGQFKRFKLCYEKSEGNWNLILPQALKMFFDRHGFKKINVKFTSTYTEDYLFLPLALIIYPIFFTYLMTRKSHLSRRERLSLFPFQSLLARHYVISGQKA